MLDRTDHNRLAEAASRRLGIGGNNPPSLIDMAKDAMAALNEYLNGHPVIATQEAARAGKLLKDRADAAIKDMEDERDAKVRPLNEQVATINTLYRAAREPLRKVLDELRSRLTAFTKAEEAKRQQAAQAARQAAEEAEAAARAAEAAETEAIENAGMGQLDTNVADVTAAADQAFTDFQRAGRAADRAERDTHVKIGGGFRNSISLRTHEVLTVTDWKAAIDDIGLTDTIRDAILTSARAYRKANEELPDGITATQDRSI